MTEKSNSYNRLAPFSVNSISEDRPEEQQRIPREKKQKEELLSPENINIAFNKVFGTKNTTYAVDAEAEGYVRSKPVKMYNQKTKEVEQKRIPIKLANAMVSVGVAKKVNDNIEVKGNLTVEGFVESFFETNKNLNSRASVGANYKNKDFSVGSGIKFDPENPSKNPQINIGGKIKFNKGGTTMKNDPPVGSTPSEVADDIPAMISEGEFVIPADVVRYIGLDKIREIMHQAKHGLACMEDEGLIVDVDEEGRPQSDQKEKSDDNVAIIETVQIEKVDPMMTQMAEGGMTDKDSPVTSPILNPENKPVMNQGGMVIAPDGSLRMAEGGMPMQMDQMMMEEMPSEEPEMAMPPELSDEMAPQEAEPMPEAPMMNAPVAQEFNGVPHLMAYLQEDEIKALQEAGRGIDENGEQKLSPEGIPVFAPGGSSSGADGSEAGAGTGSGPTGEMGGGAGNVGTEGTGGDPSSQSGSSGGFGGSGVGNDPSAGSDGGMNDETKFEDVSKEIKKELSPEKQDKTYVAGVGFIDKYIKERTSRPNPLQGKPAYAVATVAQGGLMRTPVHLQGGGMMDEEDNFGEPDPQVEVVNEALPNEDPVSSPSSPVASAVEESPVASETSASPTTPSGLMQDPFAPNEVRSALSSQYDGELDDPTLDYLSNNRDVLESIVGGKPTLDPQDLMDASRTHFNEFGKNEDRMGDGLYRAQERTPEMFLEDGNPNQLIETQNIAKILDKQPDIGDASLDYLTQNTDVFRDAEGRVNSEEGATYDGVAKEHYNLYGKAEGDRRGTEGLASFFSRPEDTTTDTTTDPATNTTTGTTTDDSSNTEGDPDNYIGSVAYNSNMFDERGDLQNAGEYAVSVPKGGYTANNPAPDPNLGFKNAMSAKKEGGTGFFTREQLQYFKDIVETQDYYNQDPSYGKDGGFDNFFEHKGGNTFDLKPGTPISSAFARSSGGSGGAWFDINGNRTTIENAVYQRGGKKGQPLSVRDVIAVGTNGLKGLSNQYGGAGDGESADDSDE